MHFSCTYMHKSYIHYTQGREDARENSTLHFIYTALIPRYKILRARAYTYLVSIAMYVACVVLPCIIYIYYAGPIFTSARVDYYRSVCL